MSEWEKVLRKRIRVQEDKTAKWRQMGLAQGRGIFVRLPAHTMQSEEEELAAFQEHGEDQSIGYVHWTIDPTLEQPTRQQIDELLRHGLGNTEDTQYLIEDLDTIWDTFDFLKDLFGVEDAYKMINAPDGAAP